MKPAPLPAARLVAGDFIQDVLTRPDALVYFLCNVGDGDAQVLLLPQTGIPPKRQAIVVDVAIQGKVPSLLHALEGAGILDLTADADEPIALVVASHPHQDHIGGLPEFMHEFGDRVAEFWDPGYFHAIPAYHQLMAEVEKRPRLLYAQPTSGLRRWVSNVGIAVLSPAVGLRNRFDSYGTEINDSSISLRIDFPLHRYLQGRPEQGQPTTAPPARALVLGADAQTTSWAFALVDFPFLRKSDTPAARAIAAAQSDVDLLAADVVKVSHHGSKHGVNLELIERLSAKLTLISSVGGGGKYGFPHTVAQDLIREGLDPTTTSGRAHPRDWEMGIFYTSDTDPAGTEIGSVGLVMDQRECSMWRFGDAPGVSVDLTNAHQWDKDPW